ncbi:MAG TPA: MarR family transcriptional regulator [Chloroflexota bacterium]|nr:MarR family transcriptional regulator [Chloroflexota bacterium]
MENLTPLDLEQFSLHELMPFWGRLICWLGMEPLHHRMIEAGLSESEYVVLQRLRRGALSVADVGACLFISHSAASRAVDRLVRDGYVRREENPVDRRQKVLTLTEEGVALAASLEAVLAAGVETMLTPLNEEEREQSRRLLLRMIVAQLPRLDGMCGSMATGESGPIVETRIETSPIGVQLPVLGAGASGLSQ